MDERFNAVQKQINLCKYPPETASILQRDISWFYLKDEDFMSKALNKGCADLKQYSASKVYQLAKKLESSKATARHIKLATGNPQKKLKRLKKEYPLHVKKNGEDQKMDVNGAENASFNKTEKIKKKRRGWPKTIDRAYYVYLKNLPEKGKQ